MRMNRKKRQMMTIMLVVMMAFSVLTTEKVVSATEGTVPTEATTEALNTQTSSNTSNESDSSDTTNTDANGVLGKNSDVGIEVTESIKGAAGKNVSVSFQLQSNNEEKIKLKCVYPVIDSTFPFETSGDAYKVISAKDDIEKQKLLDASFKMKVRTDVITGYHSVRFIGEYTKIAADGSSKDYYIIKTINIYFDGKTPSTTQESDNSQNDKEEDDEDDDDDDRGYDDRYYAEDDDDDDDAEPVAPKLIVTGFETVPEKVMAGETFTITIHIQNASKSTSVCNGKFLVGNEAGSFLPTSGSSAVFVESIPAGKTGDVKIEMKAGADLKQKNYSLVVKGDFDDGKGNSFTSSDSLIIPVYQKASFAITEVSMTPEVLGIDAEATLMFTINNKSSADVYNVKVNAKSDAVSSEESYVGNIAGSSSGYATLPLKGVKENKETGTIVVVISYEDADGVIGTAEETVSCMVSESADWEGLDEFDEEFYDEEEDYEEEEEGFYLETWMIVAIAVVVALFVIGLIIFLVRRRKKRMAALLEMEDGEDDLYDENF